jgi:hypothetical protein
MAAKTPTWERRIMPDLTDAEVGGLRRAAQTAYDQYMQLYGTISDVERRYSDLGVWVLAAILGGPQYSGTVGDIVCRSARARDGLRAKFGGSLSPRMLALQAAADALTAPPRAPGDWIAPIVEDFSRTEVWALAGMIHDRAFTLAGDTAPPEPASYCADVIARAFGDYADVWQRYGRRPNLKRFLRDWQAEEDELDEMLDEAIAKDC